MSARSDAHELHDAVREALGDEGLDRLMWCVRHGATEEIRQAASRRPPLGSPSAFEVMDYADALRRLYHEGPARGGRTGPSVLEDLRGDPVIGDAANLLRRGHEDAALAVVLANEGYPADAVESALRLLSTEVRGSDVALVPIRVQGAGGLTGREGETGLFARFGDEVARGMVVRHSPEAVAFSGGGLYELVGSLSQAWATVPRGGDDHRAHLSRLLAGLAGPDGSLRAGTTIGDVVDAIVEGESTP